MEQFITQLRSIVYYRYKKQLIKTDLLRRKPFTQFTGTDTFKFLKLTFKNKHAYDTYARKLLFPIRLSGAQPYKFDLYESNIDPVLKFIHMTKIKPAGWILLPKGTYTIMNAKCERTSLTNFEVKMPWDHVQPYEKLESVSTNIMAFDIEADSSHGDFPIGIKNYQKLSQDLVTLYNEYGVQTKKTHMHPLFRTSTKQVIQTLLRLVFDDNYNNSQIHQIHTVNQLKPNPDTIEQLSYTILMLHELHLEMETMCEQLTDLFETNLPPIETQRDHNSHYELMARELNTQLTFLNKTNNKRFREAPLPVISMMLNLPFEDYYDAFNVSNIYTKENLKPDAMILESLVPSVVSLLQDCANFVHFKKIPDSIKPEERANLTQDYFVHAMTDLFNQYLPPVEGDKLIQIGSTFQLTGQPDCYLKHIICLNSCNPITNEEMIQFENKDIYLPVDELAHDLVRYELQLTVGSGGSTGSAGSAEPTVAPPTEEQIKNLIKNKIKEIKTWEIPYRKQQCQKAAEYRRIKQSQTDHAKVVVECYDSERDVLLAWKELIRTNDPDVVIGYNIFGFDFQFMSDRASELQCMEEFCQLGRLKACTEKIHEQKLSSSGLGDNTLKYIPMTGRVLADLYKIMQSSHKLDSYKLTNVCHKFLYKEKVDITPREIFNLQKGNSEDRKKIATYCLVDCILCNRLVLKLEILNNNIAMANVCKVPFSYLFLRGQGVKIFSLVADFCAQKGYLIPVLPKADPTNNEKYEGAIVLTPETGIHFEPISVGDFNSLYPSSMISENISHDSFVEIGGKYDNLPGYTYSDIEYDIYKTETLPGRKKTIKKKIGVKTCRYAQLPNGEKSILPQILMGLLAARKVAKNKMDEAESER